MAGSENQKFKLLYLYQILMEETDEEHALTTPQLIEKLAAKGTLSCPSTRLFLGNW